MTRRWSPKSLPIGRIPGVTNLKSGPQVLRKISTSCGEQTTPSNPARCVKFARRKTCSSGEELIPICNKSKSSMLVNTVTAINNGASFP